jgi:membrane protein insertase Oxa1/YidC/SpoIIIJ
MGDSTEPDQDIFDRGPRLKRIGLAMLIAGVATFFMLRSMINSGKGPQKDPIGQTSVVMMGVMMFVLSAVMVHKFIVRIHEQRKRQRAAKR